MPSESQDQQRPRRGRHFYGPGPYIERDVDDNLLESLRAGEYALVFAPRGVGKTSLRIRATKLLEADEIRVATVDLGAIGAENRADAFCASLLIEAARTLGLDEKAKKAWRRSKGPPQMRLRACLREVLLEPDETPLVLFIDELELVRSLGPARDDFFAALRAMADARGHDPVWARLSVCLVGAITRDELISDPGRSSFDLPAREHAPRDFNREQLEGFAETLAPLEVDTKALLDALYDWTAGSPALLQWLCGDLLLRELSRGHEATAVEAIVRETFLQRGPELDPLLGDTARRLRRDHRDPHRTRILAAYERVLRGETIDLRGRQLGSEGAQIVGRMKVAGLVAASSGGKLRVRNRIVERVFDRNWVRRALAGRPVSDALEKWEKSGRRPAQLLRGEPLRAASEWIEGRPDVTPSERDFVFASERAHSRRLRGMLGVGSALSLGLGAALGVLSWQARLDADDGGGDGGEGEAPVEIANDTSADAVELPSTPELSPTALDPAPAIPSFVDAAREAVGQGALDRETQASLTKMANDIAVLEQRLAIERAARAELLAPDPNTRAEGLELALHAVSAWLDAGWDLTDAPPPLTRGLTANLPSAGDTSSFIAHQGPIEQLEIAAKGGRFASASGAEVRIWERDSGRKIAQRSHLGGDVRQLALSANGTHVAALADEDKLVVWNLDEGTAHGPAAIGVPLGAPMPLAPIDAISIDDSAQVTLVRSDGSVDTVSPAAGHASSRLQTSAVPRDLPFDRAITINSALATNVALVTDTHVELWSVAQGQAQASTPLTEDLLDTRVAALLATPAAAQLLLLPEDSAAITVWDSARGVLRPLASQDQAIRAIALSATGELLATGGDEGRAMLWSVASGERLASFDVHDEVITSLAFTPDGATLLVGDRSGRVRGYPVSVGHSELPLQAAALAADGRAASIHFDANAIELRWAGAQTSSYWPLGERSVAEAALSVDGSLLALRSAEGSLDLVSGATGPTAEPILHIDEQVLDVELHAGGQLLVVASEARTVKLFAADGRTIATLSGHDAPVDRVTLSPDGSRLASADRSKVVRVWDPGTAALLSTFEIERIPDQLALNGDHLLAIDARGSASLWSIEGRERLAEFELGVEPIVGIALSDDGQWFALGRGRGADERGRVELWGTSMPEAIASFRARAPVTRLHFGDGGQTLLAVDGQAQLARWPAQPEVWIAEACALLGSGSIIPSACEADESADQQH